MLDADIFRAILEPLLLVGENGVIIDCNAAAVRFVAGGSSQQVIGRNLVDFSLPMHGSGETVRASALHTLQQVLVTGSHREEWVHYKLDGSAVALAVTFSKVEGSDPCLVLVYWRDISEYKRIEDELRRSEEHSRLLSVTREISERRQRDEQLRQLNATLEQRVRERTLELEAANSKLAKAAQHKDEFLATVSHELRTPLTGILSFAQALEEEVYGVLPQRQAQAVRLIRQAGDHLLSLINGILDLSQLQAEQLHINRKTVSVDYMCRLSLSALAQLEYGSQHLFSYVIDRPELTIEADEQRIVQMLGHLLRNAAKFTPAGGKIDLQVQTDSAARRLTLSVSDTGIGIDANDLSRLFQPFVQLDARLARQYQGVGIGLALVRAIAELHGGSVSVESALGAGSRFAVTLPFA